MTRIMIFVLSLIATTATFADLDNNPDPNAPVCPSLSQVLQVHFDAIYNYGGDYQFVAYYEDLNNLGTPRLWYEAEIKLASNDLDVAQDKISKIDTALNYNAVKESIWGTKWWICYYESSDPNENAQIITATASDEGLLSSNRHHPALSFLK